MSYQIDNLSYSLAKRIPDMENGFFISTSYGDITLSGEEAKTIITATRKIIERKLAHAQVKESLRAQLVKLEGGAA
jgi:hypothetical protein